ncbi:MAG: sulfurtransferase, partial [Burkholderiales bacterium]
MPFATLISIADLAKNLNNPEFVIFDCRHELTDPDYGSRAYAESHLPNARFAHVDRNLAGPLTGDNGRHPLPEMQRFVDWLGKMGISSEKQVIGYDNAGAVYASRLWWMLRWLGHENVAALDGGWNAWVSAGQPVTSQVPTPTPAKFGARPRDAWVDVSYVLSTLNSPALTLIDARSN